MNEIYNIKLVKIIVEMAIFLEFTDKKLLDEDSAIEAMEAIANELQGMGGNERSKLVEQIKYLGSTYKDEKKINFIKNLPESLGLI